MQQQQNSSLQPLPGRVIIDICSNGFIVTLPGLTPANELMDSMAQLMPGIINQVVQAGEDDTELTAIREEQAAQEKAQRPGYELKPMRNCFVFPTLQETMNFIGEQVYKATDL